jgi:signal transduction histidine kinase
MTEPNNNERWLAYELHDRLLPWVHGARMLLSGLEVTESSAQNLATANHCLKLAAEEGRMLIGFLENLGQENAFDFREAVEQFIENSIPLAEAAKQKIELNLQNFPDVLSPVRSWSVLRVVQQAVLNAIQHAGPCGIRIHSQLGDNEWVITIADSGKGFDLNGSSQPNHFGLSSMQQRADSLQGKVEIESRLGKGTTVTVRLPEN